MEKKGYFVQALNYVTARKNASPLIEEDEELADPDYLIDFRANRVSLHLFPTTVWSKYMRESLSLSGDLLFQTVPYKGLFELRKAIAEDLLRSRNMKVSPSQIIIGAGTEYLYNRLLVLLKKDAIFASADPGYKRFERIASNYDVKWQYIPTDESNIRIDKLEESRANIVHVSPANLFPVGYAMPIKRRIELFNWVNAG
ncbi:MAG: aminotransferase class I/II-fold pyridoxal phosphate-dependent enzyme, partial [Butyrivibrio sp.]|nr:aminotransferase class I/II-fold pyridoxal phosphate-dependent enzyme [Butyrivibrio sp.]